jgi:hypothetical protein
LLEMSVLIEHFTPPRQPLMAGRREAGVMAERLRNDNMAE